MNGLQLFENHITKRDFSGSEADEYAQLLQTIHLHLGDDVFPLLEKAETEGKKLELKQDDNELMDSVVIADVYLV